MRSFFRGLALLLTFLSSVVIVAAQGACPQIVGDALGVLDDNCADLRRNQVCYGNGDIVAVNFDGKTIDSFTSRGDVSELSDISSLELSGLDEEQGLWGVALMNVQADIPDTLPGQNLSMILFGETSLQTNKDDASSFVFSSGIGNTSCNEAPNGMLIQTPEGAGQIHLSMNNIEIELGSTAYITAEAEGKFTFALLEGNSTLKIADSEVTLTDSEVTSIDLDETLQPVGEFSDPLPIENNLELPDLPMKALPKDIAASNDHILPKEGSWTFTLGEIGDKNCPSAFSGMMTKQLPLTQDVFLDFGGSDWDFETFFRNETAKAGGNMLPGTFSSPEPNHYLYSTDAADAPFSFEMTVVSETYITGYYYFDLSSASPGCEITVNFEVTYSG